jgi:predicted nucleic acid-binding protein
MIVVADTSPINYLILIGAIDVLPALYQKIVIPTAVYNELQSAATPVEVRDWITKMPDWFEVLPVTILLDDALPNLDEGERQAIALFQETNADALIIDERQGRAEAAKRGIFVIGTLGVLNSAAEKDLLHLPDAIAKLQKTTFRASPTLINSLLQLDIERKQSK